jgi:hypothetical protein
VVTGAPLGTNPSAAILVTDPCLDVTLLGGISTCHTVCAEVVGPFGRAYFISCYFQHSDPIDLYLDSIESKSS